MLRSPVLAFSLVPPFLMIGNLRLLIARQRPGTHLHSNWCRWRWCYQIMNYFAFDWKMLRHASLSARHNDSPKLPSNTDYLIAVVVAWLDLYSVRHYWKCASSFYRCPLGSADSASWSCSGSSQSSASATSLTLACFAIASVVLAALRSFLADSKSWPSKCHHPWVYHCHRKLERDRAKDWRRRSISSSRSYLYHKYSWTVSPAYPNFRW